MALLDNFIPHTAFDVVAVFDQNFKQVFPNARALKVIVKEEAKVMEHPVETGATITDHRIILPVEIELSFVLSSADYLDTYRAIKQYFLNGTLLTVQTRAGVYENQLIASLPHDEDPDQYHSLSVAVTLKQVQFSRAQYGIVPKNKNNSTTVSRGTQQGIEIPANSKKSSVAAESFDWIKDKVS